ncbi:integrase [Silvibacterium bohemicum]|uniref:Integrase n=1 Tax=Silvibacterium bohemicum TaxID=1577686 RepID=A0A841JRB4_9BACT|nr:site-specific integrase [Silvibacterium bohemicum]MBB6142955.1 integrase [Silvibacterium bohemicum]
MFRRTRYQQGTLDRVKRKEGPDCWIFRWRETGDNGKRVRRNKVIGTVEEYPTETKALVAVDALRLTINEEQPEMAQQPASVAALVKHFKELELGPIKEGDEEEGRAYSTRSTYTDILDFHVVPKWGGMKLHEVRAVAVENWLRDLKLARGSKAKIRSIMSVLFNHAIRHEFLPQGKNPITMVRQSGKRMRTPDVLEVHELIALFDQLPHRDRAMALLDTVTGLRRSELIGLKWMDVNFEDLELSVTRSVYRQRVGRCKTEISRKPVPLDPWVAEELLTWKLAAPYNQPKDWVFASTRKKGKQPYSPDSLLKRSIRPAAARAKIAKHIGWHTFRRTFTTLLKANGEDVKVVQELLRHATVKMTLEVYAQAVTPAKREAQSKLAGLLKAGSK